MYAKEDKRCFMVTIRQINDDGSHGKSMTFSVYESDKKMTLKELYDYLKKKVNETDVGGEGSG
jgi:hypothetical protein